MWPGCVNSKCASKRASRPAADARAHAAQTPQGAHIRHTLLTSVVNSLLQDNGLAARSVTMRRNVHTPAGSRPKFHKECTSGAQGLQTLQIVYCSMCPGCVNSDYASKCANQLAAGARVHAAQIPQGADIRHTPHMSIVKPNGQRCAVATNVQHLVTNQHCMSHGRLRVCVCVCVVSYTRFYD